MFPARQRIPVQASSTHVVDYGQRANNHQSDDGQCKQRLVSLIDHEVQPQLSNQELAPNILLR